MSLLDMPLGQLARHIPGATRVFHEYQLDFCCGGRQTLAEAAQARGVDGQVVAARLHVLGVEAGAPDPAQARPAELIDYILTRFHERHRQQLPELVRLARKVEHVHGTRPECPVGLADHLGVMQQELESHMQKEEQVLFLLLAQGRRAPVDGPVTVMRLEHDQHGAALQRLADLTDNLTPPRGACTTWRALYLGLATFREDLMEHIHLENNVLFEDATRASQP